LSSPRVYFGAAQNHLEAMTETSKLHRHPLSGHCHRVELFLSRLRLPFEAVEQGAP
jgi:hypothetical protein